MADETTSNAGWVTLAALVAVTLGIAVFMLLPWSGSEVQSTTPTDIAEPVPVAVAELPPPPEPAPPMVPQFDTFRVEPDGSMVVAGRAEPGQVVDIILAGRAVERVTADGSGSFVAFLMAGASDDPRKLSLLADPNGTATPSETSYIVAPIVVAATTQSTEVPGGIVVGAAGPETLASPIPVTTVEASVDPTLPQGPTVPQEDTVIAAAVPAPPSTPTVLEADTNGVRVVQSGQSVSDAAANVALDAITYDPAGEVLLSGRAVGDGAVQIYINNESVRTAAVTQGGDWQIGLPDIDTGLYTLRIDEVDSAGKVVSRVETPFKREEAGDVAAVLAEETANPNFEVAVKTVQPGSTLWAIAEENLGDGIMYVAVFEANRDLIKDPDLIYPGQIFRIPEINQ